MATKNNTVTISEARYMQLLKAESMLENVIGSEMPNKGIGFKTPKVEAAKVEKFVKPAKVEPVVSAELRAKVCKQIEADAAVAKAKGERKYEGGKYYFAGYTATKVGYAAIAAGRLDHSAMKDTTVIQVAKDYGFIK